MIVPRDYEPPDAAARLDAQQYSVKVKSNWENVCPWGSRQWKGFFIVKKTNNYYTKRIKNGKKHEKRTFQDGRVSKTDNISEHLKLG